MPIIAMKAFWGVCGSNSSPQGMDRFGHFWLIEPGALTEWNFRQMFDHLRENFILFTNNSNYWLRKHQQMIKDCVPKAQKFSKWTILGVLALIFRQNLKNCKNIYFLLLKVFKPIKTGWNSHFSAIFVQFHTFKQKN